MRRQCLPLRVLCVDDNEDAAESTAMLLDMLGCEAECCYRGDAAVALARVVRPDVCLVDLNMPEMDGCAVARQLREQAGERPLLLVAVTAHGDAEVRRRTAEAGFDHHLVKPFEIDALVAALNGFAKRALRARLRRRGLLIG